MDRDTRGENAELVQCMSPHENRASSRSLPLALILRTIRGIPVRSRPCRTRARPETMLSHVYLVIKTIILTTDHSGTLRHPEIAVLIHKVRHILARDPPRSSRGRLAKPHPIFIIVLQVRVRVQLLAGRYSIVEALLRMDHRCFTIHEGITMRNYRWNVAVQSSSMGHETRCDDLEILIRSRVGVGKGELQKHCDAIFGMERDSRVRDLDAHRPGVGP